MQTPPPPSTFTSPLFIGMDVHNATIAVCVYNDKTGGIIDERQLPNDLPMIRKYMDRVRKRHGEPQCCYEASSCEFVLYRASRAMGCAVCGDCAVVPSEAVW